MQDCLNQFIVGIHSEPKFDDCWLRINGITPVCETIQGYYDNTTVTHNGKWKADCSIVLTKPRDFIRISLSLSCFNEHFLVFFCFVILIFHFILCAV